MLKIKVSGPFRNLKHFQLRCILKIYTRVLIFTKIGGYIFNRLDTATLDELQNIICCAIIGVTIVIVILLRII